MKNFNQFKVIQLSISLLLTLITVFFLLSTEVKQFVFTTRPATILFVLIWVLQLVSYLFLLLDFFHISSLKHDYNSLYSAAYSDNLAKIPNRFSCDTIIEKYADNLLPYTVGCIVLELSNLGYINAELDHAAGNKLLKDFSAILSQAAGSICFVGRNGGNNFLAIFEECTQEKIDLFLSKLERRVEKYNSTAGEIRIEYRIGIAQNSAEQLSQITKLIALANERARNPEH